MTPRNNGHAELPIGEFCELINGRAFKPSEWTSGGLPIVRIQNLNDETKPFNYFDRDYNPRHEVNNGDLLFSWSGTPGTSFGAFFWNRGKGILNQHIFNVLVDRTRIDLRYLRYALNHRLDRIIVQAHGGVGLQHITKEKLEAVTIPLPPLREQKRIADILDKADAIRRKGEEGIRLTEELLRSTFLGMFGDPATNRGNWPTASLGSIAKLDRGRSRHRPRDEPSLYGGPYPFIQTGDVAKSDGYISAFTQTYSESGLAQSKLWPAGTLCITIAANIAKTAILSMEACFPDSLVGLVVGDRLTIEYVRFWFVAMEKVIDAAATQVAQKNINLEILNKLTIPVPPLSLQQRFAEIVKHVYAVKRQRTDAASECAVLFESLVQRAFRGELANGASK